MTKEPNMIIFGESHFQQSSVGYINQSILGYKPIVRDKNREKEYNV